MFTFKLNIMQMQSHHSLAKIIICKMLFQIKERELHAYGCTNLFIPIFFNNFTWFKRNTSRRKYFITTLLSFGTFPTTSINDCATPGYWIGSKQFSINQLLCPYHPPLNIVNIHHPLHLFIIVSYFITLTNIHYLSLHTSLGQYRHRLAPQTRNSIHKLARCYILHMLTRKCPSTDVNTNWSCSAYACQCAHANTLSPLLNKQRPCF